MKNIIDIIVNDDEKTVTCQKTKKVYEVSGLVISKDTGEVFYKFGTPMCGRVMYKGFTHKADVHSNTHVNIL